MRTEQPRDFGACLWCDEAVQAGENWIVAEYTERKRVHAHCADAWESAGRSLLELAGGQLSHVVVAPRRLRR